MEKGPELKNTGEMELNEVVSSVFGDWNSLRNIVREAIKNYEQMNRKNEIGKSSFVRELMGNYANTATSDEFKLCIQAVNIAIGQEENKKESSKYNVPGYTDKEVLKEIDRFHSRGAYAHEKQLGGNDD
jgi:hypothetical protein